MEWIKLFKRKKPIRPEPKFEDNWKQENPIIKRTIYILILFIPISMLFSKQINILTELISIKFNTLIDAQIIFILILIIIAGLLSFFIELIKKFIH